jgi:hypothetical protein
MQTKLLFTLLLVAIAAFNTAFGQTDEEPILYYQMEPLDDSLFIQIQSEVFIEPADPKAEIIVDLRDPNNQTVAIRGALYPFLAFDPETRARITTYPFKLNLGENIHFGSVFTRVFDRMSLNRLLGPPTLTQISATRHFVNPFLQLFGGERFGLPLKNDIGISFGFGTPYSGPLETNYMEGNFHILGFTAGIYGAMDALTTIKEVNNHNNLYVTTGYKFSYVLPFGNFFEVGYSDVVDSPTPEDLRNYTQFDTLGYRAKIVEAGYFNWEFRYPFSLLGSTRGKFYVSQFLGEWHIGFTGRELALAGSIFDLRLDAMPKSDVRQPEYVLDILVQRIFENWAFSSFAIGPSAVFSQTSGGGFGVVSMFFNLRLKVGTSL